MKLSNLNYYSVLFNKNLDEIEKIVFEDNSELEKCKVGIIFGGVSMIPHRVNKAIELYNSGLIKKIMVSGGIGYLNRDRKKTEAQKMYNYLIEIGIPSLDILIEDKSCNTYENIVFGLKILKKHFNLNKDKIMLITSDFHIRRCKEMISFLDKNVNVYCCGVKDGKTDINSWRKSLYGKVTILKEALLLRYSYKHKLINDIYFNENKKE